MGKSSKVSWIFIAFVLATFYTLGATLIESLVNYPSWYIMGPADEWLPYRQYLTPRIILTLAVPALFIQLITTILMLYNRPQVISRSSVWICLILVVIVVISSAAIQIPIQFDLNEAYDKAALDRIIVTDIWLRIVPAFIKTAIVCSMMYKTLNPSKTR